MALKFTVDSLDGVDEAARGFYKEAEGGGFSLQVEGAVSQDKYNTVNQRQLDNAEEAARRRKTLERVTGKLGLESAEGLDDAIEALMSGKGKPSDNEEIVAQLKSDYEGKLKEAESKYVGVKMEGAISETKAALQEAGFPAKVADMLAKTNKERLSVDEDGKIRIMSDKGTPLAGSGGDGRATFGDLASELAAAMPEFLVDNGKGGGGKPPASRGGNAPLKKFNDMSGGELSRLRKADPAEYDRLKSERNK